MSFHPIKKIARFLARPGTANTLRSLAAIAELVHTGWPM